MSRRNLKVIITVIVGSVVTIAIVSGVIILRKKIKNSKEGEFSIFNNKNLIQN